MYQVLVYNFSSIELELSQNYFNITHTLSLYKTLDIVLKSPPDVIIGMLTESSLYLLELAAKLKTLGKSVPIIACIENENSFTLKVTAERMGIIPIPKTRPYNTVINHAVYELLSIPSYGTLASSGYLTLLPSSDSDDKKRALSLSAPLFIS